MAGVNKPTRPYRVALAGMGRPAHEVAMVRGVLRYAEHAERWQFVEVGDQPGIPFQAIDLSQIDGLLVSIIERSWADAITAAGVAAVNTSNFIEDVPLPRVANDDVLTGRMGAEHLLGRGFAHFGFVEQEHAWYAQRRREAFRAVIEEESDRPCHVCRISLNEPGPGVKAIRRWLAEVPKPIAVMASTDFLGRHTIDTAAALGLRVPDDVAVLGVDNYEWMSALAVVSMSSIDADWLQIGYRAAQMLDGLLAGEKHDRPRWIPPVGVVTRRSTDIALADDPLVVDALRFIRDHCTEGISVDHVLDALGVSRRSLETRIKRATGQTPQTAIFRAQLDRAKKLLVETDLAIGQIALRCGLPSRRDSTICSNDWSA
jgi:LacI family transcriptional regulator